MTTSKISFKKHSTIQTKLISPIYHKQNLNFNILHIRTDVHKVYTASRLAPYQTLQCQILIAVDSKL